MSVITLAAAHLVTDTVTINFEGEQIPVHLEFLPAGDDEAAGSVEMYDESQPHELPTPLGDYEVDIFGTITFDVDAGLGLAEAIVAAGLGSAMATDLHYKAGTLRRTVRVYADALTETD